MRGVVLGRAGWAAVGAAAAILAGVTPAGLAGGTPENVLLVIDPARPDAQYVGNYYRNARNIPDSNILYMPPDAVSFQVWSGHHLEALFGKIANDRLSDHIDYIVLAPPSQYRVSAAGLISDGCSPVQRFSVTGMYKMAFIVDEILAGGETSQKVQGYYRPTDGARAFDSSVPWWNGIPRDDTHLFARRYFISALLGWTGVRGNSVEEILDMIDRSVAVDGTRPGGTFYFMQTTDAARSGPRHNFFPSAVNSIIAEGGQAQHLFAVLPTGQHDVLGIMTGWASPGIDAADIGILPGAFCDHLTSFAATFDTESQEKISRWIVKGASGSWGTIEEPCNYPGKFPYANMHVFYYKGLSLGEAVFRSVEFVPFQGLLYGDPLTRPFAYLPEVDVPDAPAAPVSGTITLTPTAMTAHPTAAIAGYELLINGVLHSEIGFGQAFSVDTTRLGDGHHDIRVLAFDDTLVKSTGRWIGSMSVNNTGHTIALDIAPMAGDWTTPFVFDVSASGAGIEEVRIVQNGRVVAAEAGSSGVFTVYGLTLGSGPVSVQAEALLPGGRTVRTAPQLLDIAFSGGTPSGDPPVAFGYTKRVRPDVPVLVDLPATFDDVDTPLTYTMITNPSQATVAEYLVDSSRLIRPNPGASGTDLMRFQVLSAAGSSAVAEIRLIYSPCAGDADEDGQVTLADLSILLTNFGISSGATWAQGDFNGDGAVDLADLSALLTAFGTNCP